jgi:chromosome segregation ATPase
LELQALALERRLAEERDEREHLQAELAALRGQLERQADHQASAVARAEELVGLEGELAALKARLEALEDERDAANTRAQRAEAELERIDRPPAPLSRRTRPRTAAHREWSPGQRIAVVGTVLAALVVLLIVLLVLL